MSEHNHVVSKDGSVTMNRVTDALDRIDPGQKEMILDNFGQFKAYLGKRIQLAQKSASATNSWHWPPRKSPIIWQRTRSPAIAKRSCCWNCGRPGTRRSATGWRICW